MQPPQRSRPARLAELAPRRRAAISLTPLIDVVFILLVFFMLASSFLDWRAISLDTVESPPTVRRASEERPLLVGVGAKETRLNGEVLPMDELLERLQQRLASDPEASVQIQPLGDTRLQAVISVLDRLTLAGISRLTMVRDRSWQDHRGSGGPAIDDAL